MGAATRSSARPFARENCRLAPTAGLIRLSPALAGASETGVETPVATMQKLPLLLPLRGKRAPTGRAAQRAPTIAFSDELEHGDIVVDDTTDFIAEVLAGRFVLTGDAERVNANALGAKNLLAARKAAGDLVDIELAETVLFEQARQLRDAWMNWPARVGPLIAARLGVAPEPVVEALNEYVQQQLRDLGEPDPDFADPDEE